MDPRWVYLAGVLAIALYLTWDAWVAPALSARALDRDLDIDAD